MPKQPALPGLRDAMKKKQTRRELFLAEMDAVVPWGRLLALIAPHYPKAGSKGGRPPMPLATMLRVYFLQNWYALSDPMAECRVALKLGHPQFVCHGLTELLRLKGSVCGIEKALGTHQQCAGG